MQCLDWQFSVCLQDAEPGESIARQPPKKDQFAEGVTILNQELKTPKQKTETDSREVVDQQSTSATAKQSPETSTQTYGSAAAFLGFRYRVYPA